MSLCLAGIRPISSGMASIPARVVPIRRGRTPIPSGIPLMPTRVELIRKRLRPIRSRLGRIHPGMEPSLWGMVSMSTRMSRILREIGRILLGIAVIR
jgi:hypothetical protein